LFKQFAASPAERGTIIFRPGRPPDREAPFGTSTTNTARIFRPALWRHLSQRGLRNLGISTGFDDQYLTIEARPTTRKDIPSGRRRSGGAGTQRRGYAEAATRSAAHWASEIRAIARSGGRTVLWGSGSKAVAFLSAVGLKQEIEYLVDINPYRHGKFVPGSGKEIVGPGSLTEYQPDLVIAMNPIYRAEIARDLDRLGCKDAKLCALGESTTVEAAAVSTSTATGLERLAPDYWQPYGDSGRHALGLVVASQRGYRAQIAHAVPT
jgi:hypothetical protein